MFAASAIGLAIATAIFAMPKDSNAQRRNSTVSVPTRQIVSQIKSKTSIPIYLPSSLPLSERMYYYSEGSSNSYSVTFDYTPDCHGTTVCNMGAMAAERGGQFITRTQGVTRTFKNIRLAGGVRGIFHNGCGAYCTATVQWQNRGVLYQVFVKNGQEAQTIQIANSAIQGGRR